MESFKERLQELLHNKVFAYTAVILFAFFTALLFAMLSNSSTTGSSNPLDAQNYQRAGGSGGIRGNGTLNSGAAGAQSPLQKLISIITGRKATNPNDKNTTSGQGGIGGADGQQPARQGRIKVTTGADPKEILKKIKKEARAVPKIKIGHYNIETPLPTVPTEALIHQIKNTYTQPEIETMARSLGFLPFNDADVVSEKGSVTSHFFDLKNQLYLGIDKTDGSFVFSADKPIHLTSGASITGTGNSSAQEIALEAARTLGFDHPCYQATSVYTKDSEPGFNFVDIHCNWEGAGAPIISTLGIMNMPNSSRLNQVKLGQFGFENTVGSDERADDFNTMTVQLDESNGISRISSNLMKIISTTSVPGTNILDPEQAVNKLSANQADFGITTPSGAGFVDFDIIYPNNQATAQEANLTDFMLAYNIVPGFTQNYLCPVWVTRSSGDVASGYNATFIQTVKAVNDPHCTTPKLMSQAEVSADQAQANALTVDQTTPPVAGVTTFVPNNPSPIERFPTATDTSDDTLHYEDFYIEPAATTGCPQAATFTNAYQIDGDTYLAWKHDSYSRTWYVAWTSEEAFTQEIGDGGTFSASQIAQYDAIRHRIYVRVCPRTDQKACAIPDAPSQSGGSAPQAMAQTMAEGSGVAGLQERIVACQLLTTGSPSLYFYPSKTLANISVKLDPYQGVEYANPVFTNVAEQTWKLSATAGGQLTFADGTTNHRAYYEFRRYALISRLRNYELSKEGITVAKASIGKTADMIAGKLELNVKETADLKAEMEREATKVSSDSVFISLLPQSFVNEELPVAISPRPDHFYRAIFYLRAAQKNDPVNNLNLPALDREGFTVVETGVLAQ